ncbi:SpoIIE family protein phosphatase [Streptomyces sp. NPDC050625]|uniref:SpoIIE family protein phosphatase n=1 Tax=Streptomyces sp. NPDC050625 TaxID=3154629 RepID=UPI00343EE0F2
MDASAHHGGDGTRFFGATAIAVLAGDGTVLRWSCAAADLLGHTADEVCGHPVRELFADVSHPVHPAAPCETGIPAAGRVRLRHRSGRPVDVTYWMMRLEGSAEVLVLAAPTQCVAEWEQGVSFLDSLLSQKRVGVSIRDTDMAVVRTNINPEIFGGPALPPGSRLKDVMSVVDAEGAEAALREVLETGVPLLARAMRMRSPLVPGREWTLSQSAFRLEDERGRPTGVAAVITDITKQYRARRHLDLIHEAATRIGGSLDVVRTAQDLADFLVPALGDLASVELAEAVLDGDEPYKALGGGEQHWRRSAVASATGAWPAGLLERGAAIPLLPDIPPLRTVQRGKALVVDRETLIAGLGDPRLIQLFIPDGAHSMAQAPLFARGLVLGVVSVWRTGHSESFDEEDADLLTEVASRAALSVDNARRYTRERRATVALQQRLLPRATTDTAAAETAGLYLPAASGVGISGDWYDVIALPSLRVALVAGDVAGRGLHATATMGRLRTAVQTLSDLELDPSELLTHVEDVVQRLQVEAPHGQRDTVGATCLYAVYDPVARRCILASAGHPPPVLVRPDGTAQVLDVSPGLPLGVGGLPFESTTVDLEPGSVLALYTKGLINRDRDLGAGTQRLIDDLAGVCRPDRALEDIGRSLLGDQPPHDDIALLLARTRDITSDNTASWQFPADPTVVAKARAAAAHQLTAWGLDELAFTTELVVSELVTNAIRYAGGPVGLRLIRENVLVCEVTDPSNTQPRLRRAHWTDEGGRGLFLIAQLTNRWGSRYGRRGKTIWAEQPLTSAAGRPKTLPWATLS